MATSRFSLAGWLLGTLVSQGGKDTGILHVVNDDGTGTAAPGLTDTQLRATAVPVSVSGVATSAKQDTQITAEQAILATAGATTGAAVVTDANGTIQQYLRGIIVKLIAQLPATLGPKAATASLSTVAAGLPYETVAASQTAQVMGGAGAIGDVFAYASVQPTTTAPGVVTILDNAVEVAAWPGGTVGADLKPFLIYVGSPSVSGAWKITTGANVKVTAYGVFSA